MRTKRDDKTLTAIDMMINSLDNRINRLVRARTNLRQLQKQWAAENERKDNSDT